MTGSSSKEEMAHVAETRHDEGITLPRCAVWQSDEHFCRGAVWPLVSAIVALGIAVAFTAPTLAADVTTAKTKSACVKAGGMWDTTAKACKPKA